MLKKTMLKVIRETFETSTGHELRLTDDAVSAVFEREGVDELDEDAQVALLVTAEDAFKGIAIADPSITALVNKMDDRFEAELTDCINAVVKNKTSSVDVYAQFRRMYSKGTLDELPYPGTNKDDVTGTNYKPDIVEKPAVAGGTIRTVFTHDFVAATARGKAYQADIDDVKKEQTTAGSTRFKGKSAKDLKAILASATQGRNAIRSMFDRAIRLHHKLSAIEGMPFVKFEWIRGTDKEKCPMMPKEYGKADGFLVSLSPKPLWFMPVDKETKKEMGSEGRDFSVTQVLAFDPAKALKMPEGGTLAELISTAKGEPVTPEQLGEKMTGEAMDTEVVVIHAKLSQTDERAALRKRLLEKGNETARESYCALYLILKPIYEANKAWYDGVLNGEEVRRNVA